MIKSVTGSHVIGGNAWGEVATNAAGFRYYYYYISLARDVNFYLYNNDTQSNTMNYTIDAFHKPHNFVGDATALPTDILVTALQTSTVIVKGAFSAIEAITNAASYTHIAVGVQEGDGAVDNIRIYGWGRELR